MLPILAARTYALQKHSPGKKPFAPLAQLAEQLTLNHQNLEVNPLTLQKTLRIHSAEPILVPNVGVKLAPAAKQTEVSPLDKGAALAETTRGVLLTATKLFWLAWRVLNGGSSPQVRSS